MNKVIIGLVIAVVILGGIVGFLVYSTQPQIGESVVGLIDPKQRCLTLAEENYKLLQKYKGVGRAENWLTEDNEKFAKTTEEYHGVLNCIDRITPEELREIQLKYG